MSICRRLRPTSPDGGERRGHRSDGLASPGRRHWLALPGALLKNAGVQGGTAAFNFSAPESAFDFLAVGETLTLAYTVKITDAAGGSDTEIVTIRVTGTNDEPIAVADTNSVIEGATATGNVLTNDTDVDRSDVLTVSSVNLSVGNVGQAIVGTYGTLTLNSDGSYQYVTNNAAAGGQTVTETFNYTVTDSHGGADAIFIDFDAADGYTPGAIANGQNGWSITNASFDQDVVANAGGQGWQLTRQFTSGSFGDQPFTPGLGQKSGEPSEPGRTTSFFEASWTMSPNALQPGATAGFIGVSMDDGTGARGNLLRLENDAAGNWRLFVFDYDTVTDAFTSQFLGVLPVGVATKIGFTQEFRDGANNDVFKVFVDDALVYTGVGWEDYFRDFQPFNSPPIVYDRLLFRAFLEAASWAIRAS